MVDSAFAKVDDPFLIKSSQELPLDKEEDLQFVAKFRQAISAHQASEWGMRGFQATFPKLKDCIVYEENGERKVILLSVVLLFTLGTRLVDMNQISSTFMPHLSAEANCFIRQDLGLYSH